MGDRRAGIRAGKRARQRCPRGRQRRGRRLPADRRPVVGL